MTSHDAALARVRAERREALRRFIESTNPNPTQGETT
jgi:hypothetical protein